MSKCVFCQSEAKLTAEHIFSEWMGQLLEDRRRIFRIGSSRLNIVKTWESDAIDIKAKVVCAECNNGWMSDIESKHAQPAIRDLIVSDASVLLAPERIKSIAIFGFKTAVIGNAMESKPSKSLPKTVFSRLALTRFRTALAIPSGIQVWLACLNANSIHDAFVRRRYAKGPIGMPNNFKLYACTFGFGRFVMQISAAEFTKGATRRVASPNITQSSEWDAYAIPIWPSTGRSIVWPPIKHLDGQVVDAFSDRWRRFNVPRDPIVQKFHSQSL